MLVFCYYEAITVSWVIYRVIYIGLGIPIYLEIIVPSGTRGSTRHSIYARLYNVHVMYVYILSGNNTILFYMYMIVISHC